ncbi:Uma2 family endonuclease [Micromonospora sp. CPCC 206061]|uniref:Uma2 family endonuclease n=1 Tax=Micromonospora sp. CPCC 206061 TaxID=3122410 RepID=UPI002FEF9965
MSAEPLPEWMRPPDQGYTAEDLDRIPDLPPHTELIDGSLVFVSPQKLFHTLALDVLVRGLRRSAPGDRYRVRREMSIKIGMRQRPEPDLIVVRADADAGMDQTWYPAEAVELAVEVVSPDSQIRDRERKPQIYAQAGIRHFWRAEDTSGRVTLYAYELDPATSAYGLTGIFHDRVKLTVPFDIDIDLTEIEQM